MKVQRKVYINNHLDIVMARMQVREVAKDLGFRTADQARISLAASELARILSWNTDPDVGTGEPGEIIISAANRNGHEGLQVLSRVNLSALPLEQYPPQTPLLEILNDSLAGAYKLVDENRLKKKDKQYVQVVLIKWME